MLLKRKEKKRKKNVDIDKREGPLICTVYMSTKLHETPSNSLSISLSWIFIYIHFSLFIFTLILLHYLPFLYLGYTCVLLFLFLFIYSRVYVLVWFCWYIMEVILVDYSLISITHVLHIKFDVGDLSMLYLLSMWAHKIIIIRII